jgi:serine/threonine protein kinase
VKLVRHKHTGKHYALKVMLKCCVVRLRQIEHVRNEREVLRSVADHPFVVTLYQTFQTSSTIFMLLDYVRGGELFRHLRNVGRFTKREAVFYATEIVCALEALHAMHIVYRDLKPENILLDETGHIRLTDFGFSKRVADRTWTMCGTPEYLAPEVIEGSGHGKSADWWSLGVLIYEMLVGHAPFVSATNNYTEMYELILDGKFSFPDAAQLDAPSKDIVTRLLSRDKNRRLGNLHDGAKDVQRHPFFDGIDWCAAATKQLVPPFIPQTPNGEGDSSNFEIYDADDIDAQGTATPEKARFSDLFAGF